MGRFGANPDVLHKKGMEFISHAENFDMKVAEIYNSVNRMVTSSYVSPEAAAMGRKIENYRDDLIQLTRMLNAYGNYCINASKTVVANQENIISRI